MTSSRLGCVFHGQEEMEIRKYKCAVTREICQYETDADGCKPCKECEIGKEFLKDYVSLHDEI